MNKEGSRKFVLVQKGRNFYFLFPFKGIERQGEFVDRGRVEVSVRGNLTEKSGSGRVDHVSSEMTITGGRVVSHFRKVGVGDNYWNNSLDNLWNRRHKNCQGVLNCKRTDDIVV